MGKIIIFICSVMCWASFAMGSELLDLINKERTSKGLTALVEKTELGCAAVKHANDIGSRKTCSRIGADGSNVRKRVLDCGWVNPEFLGELVACEKKPEAKYAFKAWLKVPSHYAYIMIEEMKFYGEGTKEGYWDVILAP
jgi:uncharacterized protein YkwD